MRWSALKRFCISSTQPLPEWVLHQLDTLSADQRHEVLGSPEIAIWIESLTVGEQCPSSELAIVGQIATLKKRRTSFFVPLSGSLTFEWHPFGPYILKGHSEPLSEMIIACEGGCLTLTGTRQNGAKTVYALGSEDEALPQQMFRRRSLGEGAWEIVDGWPLYQDTFNDGNVSLTLNIADKDKLHSQLERAWRLIGSVLPNALLEMTDTARYLSPIQPLGQANGIPSFSTPTMPGVLFIGTHDAAGQLLDYGYLAESCLHEHLHNRLYLLDQASPLICPSNPPGRYYSPWKKTHRPADGLLHAIYVFAHLAWFWNRVAATNDNRVMRMALERRDSQLSPLREGLDAISFSDEFTPVGRAVLGVCQQIARGLGC